MMSKMLIVISGMKDDRKLVVLLTAVVHRLVALYGCADTKRLLEATIREIDAGEFSGS